MTLPFVPGLSGQAEGATPGTHPLGNQPSGGIVGDLVGSQSIVGGLVEPYSDGFPLRSIELMPERSLFQEREIADMSFDVSDGYIKRLDNSLKMVSVCKGYTPPDGGISFILSPPPIEAYGSHGFVRDIASELLWPPALAPLHNPEIDSEFCGCHHCTGPFGTCIGAWDMPWRYDKFSNTLACEDKEKRAKLLMEKWGPDPWHRDQKLRTDDSYESSWGCALNGRTHRGGYQNVDLKTAIRLLEPELPCFTNDTYALNEVSRLKSAEPPILAEDVYDPETKKRGPLAVYGKTMYGEYHGCNFTKSSKVEIVAGNEVYDSYVEASQWVDNKPDSLYRLYTGEQSKPAGVRSRRYNARFSPLVFAAVLASYAGNVVAFTGYAGVVPPQPYGTIALDFAKFPPQDFRPSAK